MAYSLRYPLAPALLGLVSLFAASLVHAEVYRWVDKQGVVHYSDNTRAEGAAAVDLNHAENPRNAGASQPLQENTSASESEELSAVRSKQCAKAKKQLKSYQNAQKIVATEADGSQRELTADEQVKEIVRTKNRVKALCSDGG